MYPPGAYLTNLDLSARHHTQVDKAGWCTYMAGRGGDPAILTPQRFFVNVFGLNLQLRYGKDEQWQERLRI
jgi:hypothetical protein